jgi:ATPase subunit of ABC transporter with duplicated ATPase domains
MIFTSHDHKFINTIANRIIELTPSGIYDTLADFDDFLDNDEVQKKIDSMYASK